MSFGEKKKVDPTAKWSVTFMNEMSKPRGSNRAGDTFNKALFSLIKADIKEPSTVTNNGDTAPKTARAVNKASKLGNNSNTPEASPDAREESPGDRRSRGLTRSFSMNEITVLLAQPAPEEEIRAPELTSEPSSDLLNHPDQRTASTATESEIIESTSLPSSGTTTGVPTSTEVPNNSVVDNAAATKISSVISLPVNAPDDADDRCREGSDESVTRVKVPPLPVSPRSPRRGHRHARSVGSSHAMIEHVTSPRAKNSTTDSPSPRASPRTANDTSPRELLMAAGAVTGASAKDKSGNDLPKKDKKRALKKRSSKRQRPSTITNGGANNSNSDENSDSPRTIKATPNKSRRVSNSVSQIGKWFEISAKIKPQVDSCRQVLIVAAVSRVTLCHTVNVQGH